MAGRKLTSYVHVADEGGHVHVFGPDDTLPAWARKAITNPKAFGEDEDDDRTPDAKVLPVPSDKGAEKSGS